MSPRQVKTWGGLSIDDLRRRWGRETVFAYGEVDSTNEVARELADEGAPGGTIVVARSQAAGRGRAGRSWFSPEGGLYLSALFRPRRAEVPPSVTILAGLGVALELSGLTPGAPVSVKWPNDLVLDGRKLGGILAETHAGDDGAPRLVVGVGLNVAEAAWPEALEGRTIALAERASVGLPEAADAVIAGLERWLPDPPGALTPTQLDELDRRDWLKDRRIALDTGGEEPLVGQGAGIAPDGAFLFRPDRGALRRVTSGSIEVLEDER